MLSHEYAAGFFDGEGCVNLTVSGKQRHIVLRVMIVNTDLVILQAFRAQYGGHLQRPKVHKPHWKPSGKLSMTGHVAAAFLTDIAPYVRVKAGQVALGLEFWAYHCRPKAERCDYLPHQYGASGRLKGAVVEREQAFKRQMHLLNAKGVA